MRPLWTPDPQRAKNSEMSRFHRQVQDQEGGSDYGALHRWSVEKREEFWSSVWDFTGIVGDRGDAPFLEQGDLLPGSRWFPNARLNYAENLLRHGGEKTALVSLLEDGRRRTISYDELRARAAALAEALRDDGIRPGDRVAGYLPNVIEAVVAMLAATSIGAVWSSCSPDFGEQGLIDRFGQIEPKILFAADGYYYNGRRHSVLPRIPGILDRLPSVQRTVLVHVSGNSSYADRLNGVTPIDEYCSGKRADLRFERLPFDHPLYILYSSGTTGKPKCIVHSAGGALLEHQKEHVLHTDVGPDDVFFYFTTCGWMMWNWLVTGLATGCTLVLYDGSPAFPEPDRLIRLIDEEQISVFGTSAKYLSSLEKAGAKPRASQSLDSLKTILSTGSPLAPESFRYVYRDIKEDVLLSSIAGGTDLLGAFVSGNPCLPVYEGELQCAGLGMDVGVMDEEGNLVTCQKGELVCLSSFPSVPIGFWNDPEEERFRAAYFDRYPNTWTHGDFAEQTANGGFVIFGRSDATLNPGGVRIGTAEIYRQVDSLAEIAEALVVSQDWEQDCRIVLFVRLGEGLRLDDALTAQIKRSIRENASPRHVPAKIIQIADIPRTRSGKIAELAVRNVIHGLPVNNAEALANPESLECYRDLAELHT